MFRGRNKKLSTKTDGELKVHTTILREIDCPDFFLEVHPGGWIDLIYDDEECSCHSRVHIDSLECMSISNWVSIGLNFIKAARVPPSPTLH